MYLAKRLIILIIFSLFFSTINFSGIKAQDFPGGISIVPANTSIEVGQSYTVTFSNSTNDTFIGVVTPSVFKLEGGSSVKPLSDSEIQILGIDLTEYISFDSSELSLGGSQSTEISVTYQKYQTMV